VRQRLGAEVGVHGRRRIDDRELRARAFRIVGERRAQRTRVRELRREHRDARGLVEPA
jgi:hypothetical protein